MNPDDYVGLDGMRTLYEVCIAAARVGKIDDLATLLTVKSGYTQEKREVPRIAAAALLSIEDGGVELLHSIVSAPDGIILPSAALRALWLAASGQSVLKSSLGIQYPEIEITEKVRQRARDVLVDFIVTADLSEDRHSLLLAYQREEYFAAAIPPGFSEEAVNACAGRPDFNRYVMSVVRESSIVLTGSLLEEYRDLINGDLSELVYQHFLVSNPVFLDPLAADVFDRQRLGGELITDFVIRRHDYRYVVVEIEKPQDRIFTNANDFTSQFTHAAGQVLDFQGWVAENVAYAQKRLPRIESPSGLLVMGRRSALEAKQEAKLRRWCSNSRHIEVLTFDDLLDRASALYGSLRRSGTERGPATEIAEGE